jgi:hypothetical protein
MQNTGFRVLYAAFKGRSYPKRLDAFKKFYETMATCPVSKKIMTDPIIAPDGYCYQRDFLPECINKKAYKRTFIKKKSLLKGSNRTLKNAIEALSEKKNPSEDDYVEFFRSIATDNISYKLERDLILDAGYIRGESVLKKAIQAKMDTCATGAEWEHNSNPRPEIYVRYIQLQDAIQVLKMDLDPEDNENKEILDELSSTDDMVYKLQQAMYSKKLATIIAQDPWLSKNALGFDIYSKGLHILLIPCAERTVSSPVSQAIFVAIFLPFMCFVLGIPNVLFSIASLFYDPLNKELIEKRYGIPSEDITNTRMAKAMLCFLLFIITLGIKVVLEESGLVQKCNELLFPDKEYPPAALKPLLFGGIAVEIALSLSEEITGALVEKFYVPPENFEEKRDPPSQIQRRNK